MVDQKVPPPSGQIGAMTPLRKATSRMWLWALLGVGVFALGGSGVYFLAMQKSDDPATAQTMLLTAERDVTPTPSNSGIAQDGQLPDAFPTLLPTDTMWKQYRTSLYVMNYLPAWKFNYYTIQNGVQIFNPESLVADPSTKSAKLIPSQYVSIATQVSSESAIMYADKIQVACCIGPSAAPGNAAKFKKVSLVIGGEAAVAYTPVAVTPIRAWDIVLSTGKHLILIYSSMSDPKGTTIENQMINSIKILE